MKNIVTFDPETGRILSSGHADPLSLAGRNDYIVTNDYSGTYDATHYVVAGALVPRPVQGLTWPSRAATADGTDEVLLAGVLTGTQVDIFGPSTHAGVADGDDVHLTFVLPGTYTVRLTLFPYKDEKGAIHAV